MKKNKRRLVVRAETIRSLSDVSLVAVLGGAAASGSGGGLSVTCPPPKAGEGGGCVGAP